MSRGQSDSDEEYTDVTGSEVDEEVTWIEWFCHLKGNEFFVEVDDEYIQDDFNLTYLNKEITKYYEQALNMILDYDDQSDPVADDEKAMVEKAAQRLYGLIHARFILTSRGMAAMFDKYNSYVYGSCPLLDCHAQNQAVLPIGTADQLMTAGTKVFCPRCQEIFHPKSSRLETLDGAYFGTSFPHVFLLTYPHLVPQSPPRIYIPRIYGFRVSKKVKENMRKRVGYVPKSSQPNNNQASNQQISSSTSSKKILDGQMQNKGGQPVQ